MVLEAYRAKRDFRRSPEPKPGGRTKRAAHLRFVVQKHAASRLHYDFRLEADGVLKSWAVPKGPSLDPADKRLAMMVEDHPLEYFDFEGVIPEGEYGAGQVIVWDFGTYTPYVGDKPAVDRRAADRAVMDGIEEGKLSFHLQGERLQGRWALVRKRGDEWLLIKKTDATAREDLDVTRSETSVVSGRTLDELKRNPASARRWTSSSPADGAADLLKIALQPMLASLTDGPFSDPRWVFEPKLDGMRVLAVISGGKVSLNSRRGQDATHLFPGLVSELEVRAKREMILDGEVVAPGADGAPTFQLLQKRINLTKQSDIRWAEQNVPIRYYLFDLLYLEGEDLRKLPLEDRRRLLEQHAPVGHKIELVPQFPEAGEKAYEAAVSHGFEGVIAKRKDSAYDSSRSRKWLKIKANRDDDFVIGGFTAGAGRRESAFGSLLVGQFDEGRLRFAGHVGTGYDDAMLVRLLEQLKPLRTDRCPFDPKPKLHTETFWVLPELVSSVKFLERTRDGILRAPVFLGLRPDKSPREAVVTRAG